MSTYAQEPVEQRSSIKVTRNAKGDPQWDVKVVAGETDEALHTMRRQAIEQHRALERELAGGAS